MKLKTIGFALLGAFTLVALTSCGSKKSEPTTPKYPYDGTYQVNKVTTSPDKVTVEGKDIDVQNLFLGDALMKLGNISTIRIASGRVVFVGGGKEFPGTSTVEGTLKAENGQLLMQIGRMPMFQPLGKIVLSGNQLTTTVTISTQSIGYFSILYKAANPGAGNDDPVLKAFEALKTGGKDVAISIVATK